MPPQFVVYVAAKAAVVAISEAIRSDLSENGIGVTVLCPGPVATNIHEVAENRPPQFGVGEAFRSVEEAGGTKVPFPNEMTPEDAGRLVLEAILNDKLYVITHGEWRSWAEARHKAILEAMPTETDPELLAMLGVIERQDGQKEDM
jgi:short-subunit dehydrogenase